MKNQTSEQIKTIPDGVWEAVHTDRVSRNCHRTKGSTDAQGNGYPPKENESVEPLPESSRPRKDGPGGDGDQD